MERNFLMKRTEPKVKFQGKEYRVIYVDFKRQIVHIANGGDIRNVGFKDVSANCKVETNFNDSESNKIFVGDTIKVNDAEYVVSNTPHLVPKGFDEEKHNKDVFEKCKILKKL